MTLRYEPTALPSSYIHYFLHNFGKEKSNPHTMLQKHCPTINDNPLFLTLYKFFFIRIIILSRYIIKEKNLKLLLLV
jgi:hypothetical protein